MKNCKESTNTLPQFICDVANAETETKCSMFKNSWNKSKLAYV